MKSYRKPFSISQYEKIIKKNLEAAIPALIEHLPGIHPQEIPDDLQHTKERKPDALKRIRDKSGTSSCTSNFRLATTRIWFIVWANIV
ncbi:hypothetical protein WBJ53_20475 [Spirosoma sp. SC4-14]|uniref:hypothetical protein n=1 Tax=Spirosoma sp. SC4-14 TaxID=3128900 RepID=UPI0030D28748